MNPLIIYHSQCSDGFCSAWLMRKVFPAAKFHPAQHSQEPPIEDIKNRPVYIIDFCYKLFVIQRILRYAEKLILIDHHKTAQEELKNVYALSDKHHIKFDMNHSAARLTWNYLYDFFPAFMGKAFPYHSKERPHWLVNYTEDRDLWKHELPNTHEINAMIRCFEFDFDKWDEYSKMHQQTLVEGGRAILKYQASVIKQHLDKARIEEIGGYEVPVVNATTLHSEIAHELCKGKPFAATYFDREDGLRQYSLRSEEIDVSEIAKQYGGGGHSMAAGFEIKWEEKCLNFQ